MGARFRSLTKRIRNADEILLQVQMPFPNSIENQKNKSSPKIEGILLPNLVEDQKNKKKGLHRNLVLYSARIRDLFVLTAPFSSNHPDASS